MNKLTILVVAFGLILITVAGCQQHDQEASAGYVTPNDQAVERSVSEPDERFSWW